MQQRHALRHAGRAGGVEQERDVVAARPWVRVVQRRGGGQVGPPHGSGRRGRQLLTGRARLGDREAQREALAPGEAGGHVDGDHVLEGRAGDELLDDRHDLVPHDRDPGAVVGERAPQLRRGVERVVLDDRGTEAQHREEGDDVLRTVRHHQGDVVAGTYAERVQAARHAAYLLVDLGVGRHPAQEVDRGAIGVVAHRVVPQVEHRGVAVVEVQGHARRVGVCPRGLLSGHGVPHVHPSWRVTEGAATPTTYRSERVRRRPGRTRLTVLRRPPCPA